MVHRMIGGVVVLMWLWMVSHMHYWVPSLEVAASSDISLYAGRGGGVFYVMLMPLLAAALLMFPGLFVDHFSPSSEMTNEPLLGAGFWRLCGYFTLLVSWGLLHLFR
jgi:hypothetical protein